MYDPLPWITTLARLIQENLNREPPDIPAAKALARAIESIAETAAAA